ncbi:ATP-binding protein [Embleya sp. NBC_00896]|uniref:ATP-binding protein n=1 Tax=Embleya sp. NBC_00896 TaxID=2975961 RepID=UPI003869FDB0|nr:HAMP domain-containing histidine kinase [Embleya sp. NBC_00896]
MTAAGRAVPARVRAWTRVRASERFRNTLRLRISAAMVAMACVTALVSGLLVREVSQNQRLDRARDIALARLDTALGEYGATGRVVTPGGAVDEPRLPTELAPLIDRGRKATMLAGDSRHRTVWAAVRIGEHVVSVASPYAIQESAQVDLDRTIVFSGAIGVALAALMGVFVAGGISRRMGHVQRATRRIADGDLEARAGPVRGRDEVAELADSVDRMAGELRERLRTEQRFTGDVAHELRTPLTGLVTAAELLPPSRPTELVRDRVHALHKLVEDLLEVSRLDAHAERADLVECDLATAVRRAAGHAEGAGNPPVEVEIRAAEHVRTDPRRLERILTNLIVNGFRHGAPPVRVVVDGSTVSVRDHGPGYPAELLESGPQRFRTGRPERGRGTGLGLTIATGQARVIGAELTFARAPGGGAEARLRLPTAPESSDAPSGRGFRAGSRAFPIDSGDADRFAD